MSSIRNRAETGLLFFDMRINGIRCREQTTLPDTSINRATLERQLRLIESEIKSGTFDYARHFPNSRQAKRFMPSVALALTPMTGITSLAAGIPFASITFGEFAEIWMGEMVPMWRISTRNLNRTLLDRYLVPVFGVTLPRFDVHLVM